MGNTQRDSLLTLHSFQGAVAAGVEAMPTRIHGHHVLLVLAHHVLDQSGRRRSLFVLLEVLKLVL